MFYGWTFVTTIGSAILLLFASCGFMVASREEEEDEGDYGSGKVFAE
jgi:hypothetical protein